MPEQTVEGKTPALTGTVAEINQQLKHYADLNMQLSRISHRLHDTSQPTAEEGKNGLPRASGHLTDLQDVNNSLSIQNTVLQDTITKLSGLI